mgnify:CR=1 FL=1
MTHNGAYTSFGIAFNQSLLAFFGCHLFNFFCFDTVLSCLDSSIFGNDSGSRDFGFRIYNHLCVFIYTQLQAILPDRFLGDIAAVDHFLKIDLDQSDLPFKSPEEFSQNQEYQVLVATSKLPRPGRFVEQSIAFYKAFCKNLLELEILHDKLLKGLSAFDVSVVHDSAENIYTEAIEDLTTHFVSTGWLNSPKKSLAVSQYKAFVTKIRCANSTRPSNWIESLSSEYEMQNRPELLSVFKLSCLCLPVSTVLPVAFTVPIEGLPDNSGSFSSCVRSLQSSVVGIPNVSTLFRDSRASARAFRLLGRGKEILKDKKFSPWNLLESSSSSRSTLLSSLEQTYCRVVSRAELLHLSAQPSSSNRTSGSEVSDAAPALSRATLAVSRCEASGTKSPKKKSKKNSPLKSN